MNLKKQHGVILDILAQIYAFIHWCFFKNIERENYSFHVFPEYVYRIFQVQTISQSIRIEIIYKKI